MRRKLEPNGESVEAYLHRRVLDPICIKVGFWRKDFDGNINLPAGAFLTPREWVKFGELVRLGGKWNETEIVPAAVVAECFKQSTAQPAYGMTWWLLGGGDEDSTEASNGRNISPKAKRLTVHRIGELGTPEVHQASYPRLFQKRCMRRYNDCLYERANPKLMQRAHRRLSPRSCCFHPPRNQTERRANEFTSIFESDFWTLTFKEEKINLGKIKTKVNWRRCEFN